MDCIFCKIIQGEIPSYKIYEDDFCYAFLDINPTSAGHTLLIPKKHLKNIYEVDEKTLGKLYKKGEELSNLLTKKLNAQGMTLNQNNDYGQEVKHYHIHLIPRYQNDNLNFKPNKSIKDIEEIYKKIMN